jgi:uncharacterized protein YkwD
MQAVPGCAPSAASLRSKQESMVAQTPNPDLERRRRRRRAGRPVASAIGLVAMLLTVISPAIVRGWDQYSFSAANEDKLVTLINQARASAGLPALADNNALHDVARWRSKDMWDRNYFSHTIPSPPGGDVFDELHDRGICYQTAGENIAVNNYPDDQTAQVAFNGWMNSSGHRAIILSTSFNRVGIGAFKGDGSEYPKKYYTGVFTKGCGSTATPTPRPTATPTPRPTATPTPRPTATPRPTPTPTPKPTKTPGPTATPRPTGTPRPTATPHSTQKPTQKPTPRPSDQPDDTPAPTPGATAVPTPAPTTEPKPEPIPEPVDSTAGNNQPWINLLLDDGYTGIGADGPVGVPTPDPVLETLPPPTEAPPPTGPSTGDGDTLQVLEPPSSQGLLDTIVGDVVASFLGK